MLDTELRRARAALRGIAAAAALILVGGAAWGEEPAAAQYPTDAQGWSEAAARDINAAYAVFLENHPGVYDKDNPHFREQLAAARQESLELARQVRDDSGYHFALMRFTAMLSDGHAVVFPIVKSASPKPKWPGFAAVWRGDGLYVAVSEVEGIAGGARVVSCDGVPVKDVIARNVFRFIGRAKEPGQWWTQAGAVFLDVGNPFVTPPKVCVFKSAGRTQSRALEWRPIDREARNRLGKEVNGEAPTPGMTQPEPGITWIAMPTFGPDEELQKTYRGAIKQIVDQRDTFRAARAIVIDLRGNGGGSSEWPAQLAEALWGKRLVDTMIDAYFKNVEVWWRASPGNTAYVRDSIGDLKKQGFDDAAKQWTVIAKGMQDALDKGEKYYVEQQTNTPAGQLGPDVPPLTTPVYVIVSGRCASACLDALDMFTRFANTKLIGAPSSADSTYLETRRETLPSKFAVVVIPNKVWVHRPRKSGEAYAPAITVTDLDWSTANFLAVVKRDLAERPHP